MSCWYTRAGARLETPKLEFDSDDEDAMELRPGREIRQLPPPDPRARSQSRYEMGARPKRSGSVASRTGGKQGVVWLGGGVRMFIGGGIVWQ
jgi:hypothetical protein